MPVDRPARNVVSRTLQSYLRGEIDNFQLDDTFCGVRTDDPLVNEVVAATWYFYDDTRRHQFAQSEEYVRHRGPWLERWSQLLLTEIEFEIPERLAVLQARLRRRGLWGVVNDLFYGRQPAFACNAFWPLSSEQEWLELGIPFVPPDSLSNASAPEPAD